MSPQILINGRPPEYEGEKLREKIARERAEDEAERLKEVDRLKREAEALRLKGSGGGSGVGVPPVTTIPATVPRVGNIVFPYQSTLFPEVLFGAGSSRDLTFPDAVKFCSDSGFFLQSLEQAVGIRCELKGSSLESEVNKYQRTSTNCLYFIESKGRKKRM